MTELIAYALICRNPGGRGGRSRRKVSQNYSDEQLMVDKPYVLECEEET